MADGDAASTMLEAAHRANGSDAAIAVNNPACSQFSNPVAGALGHTEFTELMNAFNQVTTRLERTHDQLRNEVERLRGELLEANAQLERTRRLAALGEMAAGIAHEVRNPLGSIALYAGMLRQDLASMPRELAIAEKIAKGAQALDVVVGDVLTFAKEFKLRFQSIDATEALDAAVASCRAEIDAGPTGWLRIFPAVRVCARRRGKQKPTVLGAVQPLVFEGDWALVQQALINVVRNAIEAMRECPKTLSSDQTDHTHSLHLEATTTLLLGPDGTSVEAAALRVIDSGPGIAEAIFARMFNPFFTTRAAGTGLGLAIVHRIMDAHGGRVQVANNSEGATAKSSGATIELVFPLVVTQQHPPVEHMHGGVMSRGTLGDQAPLITVPDRNLASYEASKALVQVSADSSGNAPNQGPRGGTRRGARSRSTSLKQSVHTPVSRSDSERSAHTAAARNAHDVEAAA